MRIIFRQAPLKYWENCAAYREMVRNGCVNSISFYSSNYRAYRTELQRAVNVVVQHRPKVERAMLCGIGKSHEEIQLALDVFPGISALHIVDWHRPNLDDVMKVLGQNPALREELEVTIHHADLRNPETVPEESVDFAFANKLFDLYADEEFGTQCMLARITARLATRGLLYSFDHPLPLTLDEETNFYEIAASVGLQKVAERLLKKTR